MDINQIVAAFAQHNWLLLVMIGAVYARTVFSAQSKFPITFKPNWLPVFSAIAGAVIVTDTGLMAGKSVGAAVLLGVVGFVSGGAADGMVVAIFGDTSKAPTWAKALVGFVDDVFGGQAGVSVKQTTTTTLTTSAGDGAPRDVASAASSIESVTPVEGAGPKKL